MNEDVMECPKHKLPAIPDKNMIYQCRICVEETKLMNNPPFFSGVQIFGWDIFRAFRDKNGEIIKLILMKDGIFHEYENMNWRKKHSD